MLERGADVWLTSARGERPLQIARDRAVLFEKAPEESRKGAERCVELCVCVCVCVCCMHLASCGT